MMFAAGLGTAGTPSFQALPEQNMTSPDTHRDMANAIRFLSADAVEAANSGHPGLPSCSTTPSVPFAVS